MMHVEIAISNIQEALGRQPIDVADDFRVVAHRARQSAHKLRQRQDYMALLAPTFIRPDMTTEAMADAAMKCRKAADMLVLASEYEEKQNVY